LNAKPQRTKRTAKWRLALLHYTAPPQTGGVEAILGAHARLLRRAGHDVRVIAGRGEAVLVPEVDSRHPDVEEVAGLLASGRPAERQFAALRARLAERLEPLFRDRDAVIAHNVLTMPFNLPLAAALGDLGRPVVAWTHDLAWINPRYADFHRDGWPWAVLHEAQPRTTYVAISRTRREEISEVMGLPSRSVPVVRNGIEPVAQWSLSPATLRLAERGGFRHADPLLLVPVRVTRRKRIEIALEAAARLLASHPRLKLVVSGPLGPHSADNLSYWSELGALRARLELEGAVCFLHELAPAAGPHPVDDRSIADLYRMADVVLLPSESEGFGLPLLEAALSRAPLVCADIPVLRELGTGPFTFGAGAGPEAAAEALRQALRSRVARAKRAVVKRYSWEAVVQGIERVVGAAVG
jgi:glycosyltransferase involved in cell wall biosynthesis